MRRALIIVLDSVGCGAAADAMEYGDAGCDTLGHIADACASGHGDRTGLRSGPLALPNLCGLGLGSACSASTGRLPTGLSAAPVGSSWGYGVERSAGKDTPSGHWELAGTPVPFAWGYFPQTVPSFPSDLVADLIHEGSLPGILGDCHASGTTIIEALGEEHVRTGKPICYTSADSVLQIAAHEDSFGLPRLYALCRIARRLCDPLAIGRVIARPFAGTSRADFRRTANRKDFSVPPPAGNLFARAAQAGRAVVSVGKVGDIFAHADTGEERKGAGNDANLDLALHALDTLADGGLMVANLVDFDSEFGHRRDVGGYAACLEAFDRRLPEVFARLRRNDLLVLTADHGNDPTFPGTDHTREHVPILAQCAARGEMAIGRRESLADVGASVAFHIGLAAPASGQSWIRP